MCRHGIQASGLNDERSYGLKVNNCRIVLSPQNFNSTKKHYAERRSVQLDSFECTLPCSATTALCITDVISRPVRCPGESVPKYTATCDSQESMRTSFNIHFSTQRDGSHPVQARNVCFARSRIQASRANHARLKLY
jgi:hypothetical protein